MLPSHDYSTCHDAESMRNLPSELIPHVLAFLPSSFLSCTIGRVCKSWGKYVSDFRNRLSGPISQYRSEQFSCALKGLSFELGNNDDLFSEAYGFVFKKENLTINSWDDEQLTFIKNLKKKSPVKFIIDGFTLELEENGAGNSNLLLRMYFPLFYDTLLKAGNGTSIVQRLMRNEQSELAAVMGTFVSNSAFFKCPDELVVWKLFERVFTLDAQHGFWSNVFGESITKANYGENQELIDAQFLIELGLVLDLLALWIRMGLKPQANLLDKSCMTRKTIPIYDTIRSFLCYIVNRLPYNNEIIIQKSRKVLIAMNNACFENELLQELLENPQQDYPENEFVQKAKTETPNMLYTMDFSHFANNLTIFMDYISRNYLDNTTLAQFPNKAPILLVRFHNNMRNYLTHCIVSEKDVVLRRETYEMIEQCMLYLHQIGDLSSAHMVRNATETACVHRMKKTVLEQKRGSDYTNLLDDFNRIYSSTASFRNFRRYLENRGAMKPELPTIPFISIHLTDLVFIREGNSQPISIVALSRGVLQKMHEVKHQRYLDCTIDTCIPKDEMPNLEIIAKKSGLKNKLKHLFSSNTNITTRFDSNFMVIDKKLMELFTFILFFRTEIGEKELFSMSLQQEPRNNR